MDFHCNPSDFWMDSKKANPPIAPLVLFSGGTWGVGKSPFYASFSHVHMKPRQ